MFRLFIITLSLTLLPGMALAKDKQSNLERAIIDEITDSDDHNKGGRPDDPGEHGRDNAARKQAQNNGKGSGKNTSLESAILDEVFESDDDRDNKGKGKNKSKKKKK